MSKTHVRLSTCPGCGTDYALPVGQMYKCSCGSWVVGGTKGPGWIFNWLVFGFVTILMSGMTVWFLSLIGRLPK